MSPALPGRAERDVSAAAVAPRCLCRTMRRAGLLLLLLLLLGLAVVLGWGGDLLVAPDPLPAKADALVVLAGSYRGEQARQEEALRLLERGQADHLAVSAARMTYWGEWVPDLIQHYLEKRYGREQANRAVLCLHNADSTREEAEALRPCLEEQGWHSLIVVTSNYHTRRARHIWGEVFKDAAHPMKISVYGVPDGDFEPHGWWRSRRYTKTLFYETVKVVSGYLFE
jgi:uncharacterized SAM-binding protein YcdF (DUF218 family)